MKWDAKVFPVMWIWQSYGSGNGFPFHGRQYVCAIEPFSSFGENHYDIHGRVPMAEGETKETTFYAFSYDGDIAQTLSQLG